MLGYMVNIWQDLRKRRPKDKLPLIIPVLGYSGSARWKAGTDLADMIKSPGDLVFLRGPLMILREWALMDGDDLSLDLVAKAGLLALTDRGVDNLDIVDAALQIKPGLRNQFSTYIKGTATGAVLEKLEQKLAAAPSDQKEGVLGGIMEKLRAEGRAEGVVEGRNEGQARSLTRLLERRFGSLPEEVKVRIAEADHDQFDVWVDRVLDAKTLNAVFGKCVVNDRTKHRAFQSD